MCLGSQARAANKAARNQYEYQTRQYEHQLQIRERNWMNTLALENVARVQYDQTLDATHVGLGNTYAEIQEKYKDLIGETRQKSEADLVRYLQESQGDQAAASGQTGASIRRMETLDLGQYLAKGSRDAYNLTMTRRDLTKASAKAAGVARQQQLEAFARNNIIKNPDLAPPAPVAPAMQNVGSAMFMDALSIAGSIAGIGANIRKITE